MKIAFFGTPDFAIPSLAALCESKKHKVVCAVCQPDRPSGRGGKTMFSPVKEFALKHNIPVLQPEKISKEVELLDKYKPEIIVTCAFGQILKQNVLDYAEGARFSSDARGSYKDCHNYNRRNETRKGIA